MVSLILLPTEIFTTVFALATYGAMNEHAIHDDDEIVERQRLERGRTGIERRRLVGG